MWRKRLVVLALTMCACGTERKLELGSQAGSQGTAAVSPEATALAQPGGYYWMRADYRRCLFPSCGGLFLELVDQATTQCSDGSFATECYVATLELDQLALTADERTRLFDGLARVIALGTSEPRVSATGFPYYALEATGAWLGVSEVAPSGHTYFAREHGGYTVARALNQNDAVAFGSIDFKRVVAQPDDIVRAREALADGGLMVTGYAEPGHAGPATLVVTQFYFPLGVPESSPPLGR